MIKLLLKILRDQKNEMEEWLSHYSEPLNDPVYCSLDIRNSGFKIAPVDANIFPAGWNNLCPKYTESAAENFKKFIEKNYPETKKILLIPENHTRNVYYLSNLLKLSQIIEQAGFEIQIGTLNEELGEINGLKTAEGQTIIEYKIHREGNRLILKTPNNSSGNSTLFNADLVVLNNDLSAGMPEILKNLEVPLNPTPLGGWYKRRKSDHFHCYKILTEMFCNEFNIDPWLLSAYFTHTTGLNFMKKEGLELVAEKVENILRKTAKKYEQYGINVKPYVFIKNDAGTYGMAVMTAQSGEEILNMNNDARQKMNVGKGNMKVCDVIIQEGVETTDAISGNPSEPVVYLMNSQVIGGFYRVHSGRDIKQSLNTPGMTFTHHCLDEIENYKNIFNPDITLEELAPLYHLIGRLTSIATGYEIIGLKES